MRLKKKTRLWEDIKFVHNKHCEYSTSEPQFQKTVLNADCKDFLCTSNLVHKIQ